MFDMGFSEFFLIFLILLIVVGPKRLPGLARTAGHWIGKARSMVSAVRAEVEQELKVEELKQSIQSQMPVDEFKSLANDMSSLDTQVRREIADVDQKITSTMDENSATDNAVLDTDANSVVASTTADDTDTDTDSVSSSTKTSAAKAPVE